MRVGAAYLCLEWTFDGSQFWRVFSSCVVIRLNIESLNLLDCYKRRLAHSYALLTIFSRRDGASSSSSGRQRICPIWARFRPLAAALLSSSEEILKLRRHSGLTLKFFSKSWTSESMSSFLMYSKVLSEKDSSAYGNESQAKSNDWMARESGRVRPWSMGISLFLDSFVIGSVEVLTRILQAFLSRFKRRRSRTAILWTSSVGNKLGEKFSIGPSPGINTYSEPSLGATSAFPGESGWSVSEVDGLDWGVLIAALAFVLLGV